MKEQPYVGIVILSTRTEHGQGSMLEAEVVASYWIPGNAAGTKAVWVKGKSPLLTGWSTKLHDLRCVHTGYIVCPSTTLMKELL
jgi:hypothetical protein